MKSNIIKLLFITFFIYSCASGGSNSNPNSNNNQGGGGDSNDSSRDSGIQQNVSISLSNSRIEVNNELVATVIVTGYVGTGNYSFKVNNGSFTTLGSISFNSTNTPETKQFRHTPNLTGSYIYRFCISSNCKDSALIEVVPSGMAMVDDVTGDINIEASFDVHHNAGNFQSVVFSNKIFMISEDSTSRSNSYNILSYDGNSISLVSNGVAFSHREIFSFNSFNNKLYVMGGISSDTIPVLYNEVWTSNNGINWLKETDASWSGRVGHSTVVFDDKLWVMGGTTNPNNSNPTFLNDIWYLSNGRWSSVSNANWSVRANAKLLVKDNQIWLIGGLITGSINAYYNDVWSSSNGSNWSRVIANSNWMARNISSSFVYDDRLWISGGGNNLIGRGTFFNDVWYTNRSTTNWLELFNSRLFINAVVFNNKVYYFTANSSNSKLIIRSFTSQ